MISSKTYVTLERVVSASSVGLSTLELLFNHDIVIVDGSYSEFELIKVIEELVYNKDYDEICRILKQHRNG